MAPESVTQDRIYRTIKDEILGGRVELHARIDIQRIADQCLASPTPVREALCRLVGETLVEAHPDGGFRIALPDFRGLTSLYIWTGQQLLSALHLSSAAAIRQAMAGVREFRTGLKPVELASATSTTFETIAGASGNQEFVAAVQRANERLQYFRLAEPRLFGDLERELRTFFRNGTIDVKTNVRRRVIAYHRRRIEHTPQLYALVQRATTSP
jgi:DNA-binding GntR family transcriptional regulator